MRPLIKTILIILIAATTVNAQERRHDWERIHAAKIAYITDRLRLGPKQMSDFLPVYKDYEKEIWQTRQVYFKKYKGENPSHADDVTARQYVDDNLDYQQQVLDIKRKYNDRFLKVITPQQLADLYTAEREFKQILMKRLDQPRMRARRYPR